MSDFKEAPWNKAVEKEGRELAADEIPSRRRKPGEQQSDPLTDLIFSGVSFKEGFKGERESKIKVDSDSVPHSAPLSEPERGSVPLPFDKRAALLERLSQYDRSDAELSKKISQRVNRDTIEKLKQPASPSLGGPVPPPVVHAPTIIRESSIVQSPQVAQSSVDGIAPLSYPNAQDNWLGVAPVATGLGSYVTPAQGRSSTEVQADRIQDFYNKSSQKSTKRNWRRPVLVALLVLVAGGIGLATYEKGSFSFLSAVSKLFNPSSFVVSDADVEQTFPQLYELKKSVEEAENTYGGDKTLEELSNALNDFFEENAAFSWFNIFRPASARSSQITVSPAAIEKLDKVLEFKKTFEQMHVHTLDPSTAELTSYIQWLAFSRELFGRDGRYLVLIGSELRPSIGSSEPEHYALLRIQSEEAQIERSGSVADLNAALTTKIIPPASLQAVKTNLDLYEASWFLDFETSGKLVTLMYEETTGENIDGVVFISWPSKNSLGVSNGVSDQGSGWMSSFLAKLGTLSAGSWKNFSGELSQAVKRGGLQVFFERADLAEFAKTHELFIKPSSTTEDTLAASLRVWEGEARMKLLEYRPEFLADGSILGEVRVHVVGSPVSLTRAYVKIYMPLASTILDADGYAPRPKIPTFNYGQNGFAKHESVSNLSEKTLEIPAQLDTYVEGDLAVVGGWVIIPAGKEQMVRLQYRPPSRLNLSVAGDDYTLAVLPTGGSEDVPFRFAAKFQEDMVFEWTEPLGFVSGTLAEYQKTLSERLKFSATLKNNVSN